MTYIDGFVVVVPTANLESYKKDAFIAVSVF